ncbi:putative histidine kinase-group viii protein [Erysiphe necator]|uniref:Putative histidine kinase-group viii protein n=1 Tax=Uncinula necator TaxID=52586 RepID=A0A0B1PHG1_UNCNE|nr:putative histidine kinase-group viii protein [Erysiphe necator]
MRSTMRQLLGGKKSHKPTNDGNRENRSSGNDNSIIHKMNGTNDKVILASGNELRTTKSNVLSNDMSNNVENSINSSGRGYSNGLIGNSFEDDISKSYLNGYKIEHDNSFSNGMAQGNVTNHTVRNGYTSPLVNNMGYNPDMRYNNLEIEPSGINLYSSNQHENYGFPQQMARDWIPNSASNTYMASSNASSPRFDSNPVSTLTPRTLQMRASAATSVSSPQTSRSENRKIAERLRYDSPNPIDTPRVVTTVLEGNTDVVSYIPCENEPIRTPGAIQSLGALIGLRYCPTGDLEVRIASENSRKILGYGPEQLFALGSFLDILEGHSRDEMIVHLEHCIQTDRRSNTAVTRPDFFHITLKFPYEPDCSLWCTMYLLPNTEDLVICEFEDYSENYYMKDVDAAKSLPQVPHSVNDTDASPDDFRKSTTRLSKPLSPLTIAQHRKDKMFSSLDIFCCLGQIQEQIIECRDIQQVQDVIVGLVSEVTGFHRVMSYRFDQRYNGCVEAEIVNPQASTDIYRGLHYPASDIPVQARELYKTNRIRILFDREAETSRLVYRDESEFKEPIDLTHSYLRAISPIHIKYLANMGVRSSVSISLVIDNKLWGLIACHGYGEFGIRISLPMRELCRRIGECASTNIQRILTLERIRARKLPPSLPANSAPPSSDLLSLVDADFAVLNIGNKVRAIGRMEPFQEANIVINYLQSCHIDKIISTMNIKADFPELSRPPGINVLAGMLIIPLNVGKDNDFLVFFRKGQLRNIKWAGNPHEKFLVPNSEYLEPRGSFRRYIETVYDTSKEWNEDQLDTASILALLYGRFAETWRMKSGSVHPKEKDRDKNDIEKESSTAPVDDTFNLRATATRVLEALKKEAQRKALDLTVSIQEDLPATVIGDADCFKQVMLYFIRNGFRSSQSLKVDVSLIRVQEETSFVELKVQDAGPGMTEAELDETFQEFERAQSNEKWPFPNQKPPPNTNENNRGSVTLSVVATFVRSINGQIQVTSELGKGTIFIIELPYKCADSADTSKTRNPRNLLLTSPLPPKTSVKTSPSIFPARLDSSEKKLNENSMLTISNSPQSPLGLRPMEASVRPSSRTQLYTQPENGSPMPGDSNSNQALSLRETNSLKQAINTQQTINSGKNISILIADNEDASLSDMRSRLSSLGYLVEIAHDGQQCHDRFTMNPKYFDIILMELNLPLVDGILATRMIRIAEKEARHRNDSTATQSLKQRIPIIAISSTLEEESRLDYIQCGIDGWAIKPIDFHSLNLLLQGLTNPKLRQEALYVPGQLKKCGWFLP